MVFFLIIKAGDRNTLVDALHRHHCPATRFFNNAVYAQNLYICIRRIVMELDSVYIWTLACVRQK